LTETFNKDYACSCRIIAARAENYQWAIKYGSTGGGEVNASGNYKVEKGGGGTIVCTVNKLSMVKVGMKNSMW
jgi:hypothetical protein